MCIMSKEFIERAIRREHIKDTINNLYGIKLTDAEINYCEADIRATLEACGRMEEKKMNRWDLYYTRTEYGDDRVIIAKTLDEAKEYAAGRFVGCTEPVWLAEADECDKSVRANKAGASTLWTTYTREYESNITGVEKYAAEIKRAKENEEKENKTMPERNVQELLEEFDTEELVTEVKRRKEDEAWYGKFEQGMYYKVYDERKKDTAFVILRFVGFDEDCRAFAQFENVYDNNMLWIPNPRIYRCDIDRYSITKLRDGMVTLS